MSGGKEPKQQPSDILLEYILESGAVLFHDQYDETFIAYDGNGSNVSKIDSNKSKLWVTHYG
jgi:hypothetical protein